MGKTRSTADVDNNAEIIDICEKVCEKVLSVFTKRIEDRFDSLENFFADIKKTSAENQKRIDALEERLDNLEQYSRRSNLRLYGVPDQVNEDINGLVIGIISSKLKLDITLNDLDRVHRVGKKNDNMKPRAILIKFTNYQKRSLVYNNKRNLKGTSYVIREDLTRNRLEVYGQAVKKYGIRNVNTRDGLVIVRTAPDDDGNSKVLLTAASLSELN